MSWESVVEGAEYVPSVVLSQMDDIVQRAMAAGARPPLEYIGAGMTSVVFCVDGMAFKVGRNERTRRLETLQTEALWLATANTVPWVEDRVAKIYRFDSDQDVIVRECPLFGGDMTLYRFGERNLFDLHQEIGRQMLPFGWSAPEFKPDSYVITERGPVLVDASFAWRVGGRLLNHARNLINGNVHAGSRERPSDVAFDIRSEVGRTLTSEEAAGLLAELARLEAAGNRWGRKLEMRDGPAIDKKQIQIDIARAQRDEARAEIAAIKQEAKDARAACSSARQRAVDTCAAAKSIRAKRDAMVALAHDYRLIRRAELARVKKAPIARRSESDDEVLQNIPPELAPTWERVKRGVGRSDRKSRTEAFLEWVEAHPSEIVFVEPSEEDYERSYARRRVGENSSTDLTFGKFPKLSNGNDDDGKPVNLNGVVVAYLHREIDWKDAGGARASYRAMITGYYVTLTKEGYRYGNIENMLGVEYSEDRKFQTLVEAQDALRNFFILRHDRRFLTP